MLRDDIAFHTWKVSRVFLGLVGGAWIVRAFQVSLDPRITDPDWAVLHEALPMWLRTALWALTGAIAIVCAVTGRYISVGFGSAVMMPVERTVSYFWSSMAFIIPGPPSGRPQSIAWMAWWLVVTLIVLLPVIASYAHARESRKE